MNKPLIGPRLVAPAIYSFRFGREDRKEQEGWGWNRATELLEAVNEVRRLYDQFELSPREVVRTYDLTTPGMGYYTVVNGSIISNGLMEMDCWLEIAIRDDAYIPAGLGYKLMKLVKKRTGFKDRATLGLF